MFLLRVVLVSLQQRHVQACCSATAAPTAAAFMQLSVLAGLAGKVVSAYYLLWGRGITAAVYYTLYCHFLQCAAGAKASIMHVVCDVHMLLLTGVFGVHACCTVGCSLYLIWISFEASEQPGQHFTVWCNACDAVTPVACVRPVLRT
jgi:hypothetical protein